MNDDLAPHLTTARDGDVDPHASSRRFSDLGSTVDADWRSPSILSGLQLVFQASFTPAERLRTYRRADVVRVCRLEDPHLEIVFCVAGRTAQLLSPLLGVSDSAIDRVIDTIMQAFPKVRRLALELHGDARPSRPSRMIADGADHVVRLPASARGYVASLGASTRRNLRKYEHRLRATCDGLRLEAFSEGQVPARLVTQIIEWNRGRMQAKGRISNYERTPDLAVDLTRFITAHGLALRVMCGDTTIAGVVGHRVGRRCWLQVSSYSPGFDRSHLGLLTMSWVLQALCGQADEVHLSAGDPTYKLRLGGVAVPAADLVVYRDRVASVMSIRDVAFVSKRAIYATRIGRLLFLAVARLRRQAAGRGRALRAHLRRPSG